MFVFFLFYLCATGKSYCGAVIRVHIEGIASFRLDSVYQSLYIPPLHGFIISTISVCFVNTAHLVANMQSCAVDLDLRS